jgi:hypothetical protein
MLPPFPRKRESLVSMGARFRAHDGKICYYGKITTLPVTFLAAMSLSACAVCSSV